MAAHAAMECNNPPISNNCNETDEKCFHAVRYEQGKLLVELLSRVEAG
jgi:hypothetical protein